MAAKNSIPCRFYKTDTGCLKENCPFLHLSESSPHCPTSNIPCKFFSKGYCKRANQCHFRHVIDQGASSSSQVGSVGEEECYCICFEIPKEYGLLTRCNHAFCLSCIRTWRSKSSKGEDLRTSNVLKECPVCRLNSDFIVPSVVFAKDNQKEPIISSYKAALAKIPCRYFFRQGPNLHVCPFNDNCFYSHNDENGCRIPCKQRPSRSPLDPHMASRDFDSIRRMVLAQLHHHSEDFDYSESEASLYYESVCFRAHISN